MPNRFFLEHDTYKAWNKVTALPWPPRPSCRPSGVSVAHDCPAVGSPWTAELCNHNTPLPQHTFTTTHIYHNTPLPQHTFTTTHLYHNTRLPQHTFTTTHIYHNTPLPQLCGGSCILKLFIFYTQMSLKSPCPVHNISVLSTSLTVYSIIHIFYMTWNFKKVI